MDAPHEPAEPAGDDGTRAEGGDAPSSGASTRSRRRLWRRIFWRVQIALVALLALAALATLAVDIGWQRDRIVALLVARARDVLGEEIVVTRAVGRASRGLALHGVRIGPEDAPLVEIDSIEARWHLLELFGGDERVVDSLRIVGLRLRAHRERDGRWETLDASIDRLRAAMPEEDPGASPAAPWRLRRAELVGGAIELAIEPVGDRVEDSALPVGEPLRHASLRASLQVEGRARQLRIGGEDTTWPEHLALAIGLSELAAPDVDALGLSNAALDLELEGRAIRIARLDVAAPWLTAHADAQGTLDRLERLHVDLDASDLRPLAAWMQSARPTAGRVVAQAELAGPIDALTGHVGLEAHALSVEDLRADSVDLDLELEEPIGGLVGSPERFRGSVALTARGVEAGRLVGDRLPAGRADVSLVGRIEDERLDLERGVLDLAGLHLEARGRASKAALEDVSLDAKVANLAPWLQAAALDVPLSGPARIHARLEGPPRSPHGEVRIDSTGLAGAGRPLGRFDLAIARAAGAPARVQLDWSDARGLVARADGRFEPEQTRGALDFRLDLERLADVIAPHAVAASATSDVSTDEPAESIDDTRPESAVPPAAIAGLVQGHATLEPSKVGPRIGLEASAEGIRIGDLEPGRVELAASGVPDRAIDVARLEVDGALGRLSLRAPTRVTLERDGRWRLADTGLGLAGPTPNGDEAGRDDDASGGFVARLAGRGARLDDIDLHAISLPVSLVRIVRPDAPSLGGRVEGALVWRRARVEDWTRGELDWLDASIDRFSSARVALRWDSTREAATARLDVAVDERTPLVLESRLIRRPESEGDRVPFVSPDRLAFDATLQGFDLQALAGLAPSWMRNVAGRVSGRIRVEPDALGPRADGRLELADAGFTVPLLRRRFAPIRGDVVFDERVVTIESLQVGEPGADARLEARIDLEDPLDPVLQGVLRLDQLPVSRSPVLEMDAAGGLELSGRLGAPIVRGRLTVANTRVSVPDAGDPVLKEIRIRTGSRDGTIRESEARPDPLAGADVDIALEVPASTRIRGRGTNLFVEGDARIVKPPGERLRIRGEARVANGTYTFQGRRFAVRRGRVLLPGDAQLDPVLDIEARHPVADIVAIVEVTGRLSSPIVRLDSEPSRSEQDVLAYLLFGRPASEIGAAQNTRFGAAAARLVAGVAEQELREVLGDAMPVDSIEIGADAEGNTSELGFGKYLGPNLFFRYVHVLGDEPADRVGVEYRVNDQISVGSSVSTTGDAGVDLILRHDF
ncbi:MAG: translocation/assembly module TamB domain-containing protein [Myxococcota bacterium]